MFRTELRCVGFVLNLQLSLKVFLASRSLQARPIGIDIIGFNKRALNSDFQTQELMDSFNIANTTEFKNFESLQMRLRSMEISH